MRKNSPLVWALISCFLLGSLTPAAYAEEPEGMSYEDFQRFKEVLRRQNQTGLRESGASDATDSVVSDLVRYAWRERKAQLTLGGLVVGESLLAAMLWKRMRTNRATWERQVGTVREVGQRLAVVSRNYGLAEYDLARSVRALDTQDREQAVKATEKTGTRAKAILDRAFSTESPAARAVPPPPSRAERLGRFCRRMAEAVHLARPRPARSLPAPSLSVPVAESPALRERPVLSVEEATANLEKAYSQWHEAAVAEANALRAAGREGLSVPLPLGEMKEAADAAVRAVIRLDFAAGQFYGFREEGAKALARSANLNLGTNLSWRARLWRKTRTALLLLAMPLAVLGIGYASDQMEEAKRRQEDLNAASLEDRDKWLNTFIPYFHRPLLFTVVRSWNRVSQRPRSHLKLPCPYELKPAEIDNPDLAVIQSLALQTLLEMEGRGEDALKEEGRVRISARFYKNLFRKILEAESSPLLKLEPGALDQTLDELAHEAYHGFDQIDFLPPAAGVDLPAPPLGIGKDK